MSADWQAIEVLDQWDDILDADDLEGAIGDALQIALDRDVAASEVRVRVVPCVPGDPIPFGGRVSGMKVVSEIRDGIAGIGVYLFVEAE